MSIICTLWNRAKPHPLKKMATLSGKTSTCVISGTHPGLLPPSLVSRPHPQKGLQKCISFAYPKNCSNVSRPFCGWGVGTRLQKLKHMEHTHVEAVRG